MAFAVTGPAAAVLPVIVAANLAHTPVAWEPSGTTTVCTPGGAANVKAAVAELLGKAGKLAEAGAWLDVVFDAKHSGAETDAVLAKHSSTLRAMLNIGVRLNATQTPCYDVAAKDAALQAAIDKVVAAAPAGFLGGAAPNAADAIVAAALYDALALLQPPSVVGAAKPAYAAWFSVTTSSPAFEAALATTRLATGGKARIGGQVDLRPQPTRVSVLADTAIERNAGYKKAASQRDAEKSAKETQAAPAPAPAAAPAAAAVAATATQPEGNKTLPGKPAEERIALTEAKLHELGISFTTHKHAAAPDVGTLLAALEGITGARCKNLVIKAKKEKAAGDSMLWLVVALADTKVDLVDLAKRLGYGKIMLRFSTPEVMLDNLGVSPGNATPFALMNDTALQINVALDKAMLSHASGSLLFHPLTNEASTAVSPADLLKFIGATGHKVEIIDFAAPA